MSRAVAVAVVRGFVPPRTGSGVTRRTVRQVRGPRPEAWGLGPEPGCSLTDCGTRF
ncbi:hypothetical protein chiPu_0027092, partial [Chiloscyllium punctatum]|nr:hypothetical protein [Chiloscyllium punctatum]